jgi:hypothetical protein
MCNCASQVPTATQQVRARDVNHREVIEAPSPVVTAAQWILPNLFLQTSSRVALPIHGSIY